ncbi:MAG: flagellum-specific ATP synthase FliI [Rhodospirillaceae bacterium]|nr:flagellum-specific ATP synthase FliI [Rhodospirillaceae bacterium]
MSSILTDVAEEIDKIADYLVFGRVTAVQGMMVEVGGVERALAIGDRVHLNSKRGGRVTCEVVGFKEGRALAMPFSSLDGIGIGSEAEIEDADHRIYPNNAWLGRVINAMGEPIDEKGPLAAGTRAYSVRGTPPPAHTRQRIGAKVDVGVRAINTFTTICEGQRMGIFSGSGIGKSILMSMIARFCSSEVNVIGLVGERGREVREFIQDYLGEDGLTRSVVVAATSDESPLMRRQAAYMTLAVAESFRDAGKNVMCMMDSVTRFAMAQREIGLATGEAPASKGYTPMVFSELPKLLERAGPGPEGTGSITGLFTVLVEGDDHNEPISDSVRGIIDGHIILDRSIADKGRYPAIDVLKSVSRMMPDCNTPEENEVVGRARALLAAYESMADMIRLGAYRKGSDPQLDEAILYYPSLEKFLSQDKNERIEIEESYNQLTALLNMIAPQDSSLDEQETGSDENVDEEEPNQEMN